MLHTNYREWMQNKTAQACGSDCRGDFRTYIHSSEYIIGTTYVSNYLLVEMLV